MIVYKNVDNIFEGALLLANIFGADGEYYSGYNKDELISIFEYACTYCKNNGWIFGAYDNEQLIGITLRFIYSPYKISTDLVCQELQDVLNKYITEDAIYLLYTGIMPEYRGMCIGKRFEEFTNNIDSQLIKFSDFSNKKLADHMRKLGWKTLDYWNGCEIMIESGS